MSAKAASTGSSTPHAPQEKAAVIEAVGKNQERAKNNFALAAALAEKIAQLQAQLPGSGSSARRGSEEPTTSGGRNYASSGRDGGGEASFRNPAGYSGFATSSSTSGGFSGGSSGGGSWTEKAEQSIFEAQQRLRRQEQEIAAGARKAKMTAKESIEEARERLRRSELQSLEEVLHWSFYKIINHFLVFKCFCLHELSLAVANHRLLCAVYDREGWSGQVCFFPRLSL